MSSDSAHGVTLVRRVAAEHRRTVYILLAAFAVNVLVFALVVYPLRRDVANVEQRTTAAENELAAATADFGRANGTLTGKDQALKELDTFYMTVLPSDLQGARRLTYARLARLAASSHLDYARGRYEPVVERGSSLTRLKVTMELHGTYRDVRNFIHAIETATEFVTIDRVGLAEGLDSGDVRLTLGLSTYFRNAQP